MSTARRCSTRCGILCSILWLLLWEVFFGDSGPGTLWVYLLLPGKEKDKVRETTRFCDQGSSQSFYRECSAVPGLEALIQLPLNGDTKQPLSCSSPQDEHFVHSEGTLLACHWKNHVVSHETQSVQAIIMQEVPIILHFVLISSWLLQNLEHRWL